MISLFLRFVPLVSFVLIFILSGCSKTPGLLNLKSKQEISLQSERLTVLDNREPGDGFLFHEGFLWVGHSTPTPYVEVFSPTNPVPVKIPIPHGTDSIKPFGDHTVLVLGPYLSDKGLVHSAYSLLTARPSGVERTKVSTHEISPDFFFTSFTGDPGSMFFGDVGFGQIVSYKPWKGSLGQKAPEYQPESEEEEPNPQKVLDIEAPGSRLLNVSNRSNFSDVTNEDGSRDTQQISGPNKMVVKKNSLFILELKSNRFDDDEIAQMSTQGGKVSRIFNYPRRGLVDLIALDDHYPWVVAVEALEHRLLLIDSIERKLTHTITVETSPTAVRQLGHCLVVLGQNKQVHFLDLDRNGQTIDIWDLSEYGFFLDYPRKLEIDPSSNTAFVESRRNCAFCQANSNGVVKIKDRNGDTFEACRYR